MICHHKVFMPVFSGLCLFSFVDPDSSPGMKLFVYVCLHTKAATEVVNSEPTGFRLSVKPVSLWPHVLLHSCPCILSTSKTGVCVCVCVHQPVAVGFFSQGRLLACLLWINTPEPHCISTPADIRLEVSGVDRTRCAKPQTLANTWAGVSFTILFNKN